MNTADRFTNILIIKPGAIGDLIQMTPVIRALKAKYPAAGITLVVGSTVTAELFKFDPLVNETIIFDKKDVNRTVRSFLELWRRLRRTKFDLLLQFQRSNLKAWLLASAAFPCRTLVYHKARKRTVHAVSNYLETLAPLGIATRDLDLKLSTGPDDKLFAKELVTRLGALHKPLIALNPGASHPIKQWSTEQFALLADLLTEKLSAQVVLVGGTIDVPLAEEIVAKSRTKPVVLAGKTSLLQLGAVLEQCAVLVSGDTGPMHMGTAVGTRVVGLFGATDPLRTGPVGPGHTVVQAGDVACVPCKSLTCSHAVYLKCMKNITPESVFQNVVDSMKNRET
jgi:lipopolysaccharide heptosyltransferase II